MEDGETSLGVNLESRSISDSYRKEALLEKNGGTEILSWLERRYRVVLFCGITWKCEDPMTPVTTLTLFDTDRESSSLPDDAQIKARFSLIALDCMEQMETALPLDCIVYKYYHPAFDPDEVGMTWRSMTVPLGRDVPRTAELLESAKLVVED